MLTFHQWEANLRVLEVTEIKTKAPASVREVQPGQRGSWRTALASFVEQLIGTIRRENLDRLLFWTTADLEAKLREFQHFYNGYRTHAGLEGCLQSRRWEPQLHPFPSNRTGGAGTVESLYQTPIAAQKFINSPRTVSRIS